MFRGLSFYGAVCTYLHFWAVIIEYRIIQEIFCLITKKGEPLFKYLRKLSNWMKIREATDNFEICPWHISLIAPFCCCCCHTFSLYYLMRQSLAQNSKYYFLYIKVPSTESVYLLFIENNLHSNLSCTKTIFCTLWSSGIYVLIDRLSPIR